MSEHRALLDSRDRAQPGPQTPLLRVKHTSLGPTVVWNLPFTQCPPHPRSASCFHYSVLLFNSKAIKVWARRHRLGVSISRVAPSLACLSDGFTVSSVTGPVKSSVGGVTALLCRVGKSCSLARFDFDLTFLQSHYQSDWASCSVQANKGGGDHREKEDQCIFIVDGLIETHQGVDHASAGRRWEEKKNMVSSWKTHQESV